MRNKQDRFAHSGVIVTQLSIRLAPIPFKNVIIEMKLADM